MEEEEERVPELLVTSNGVSHGRRKNWAYNRKLTELTRIRKLTKVVTETNKLTELNRRVTIEYQETVN